MSDFDFLTQAPHPSLRLGICVESMSPEQKAGLELAARQCDLTIFGDVGPVAGTTRHSGAGDPSAAMIEAFQTNAIDAFVRGVNDDFTFQRKFCEAMECGPLLRLSILGPASGGPFALGPVSAAEANGREGRLHYAHRAAQLLEAFGVAPVVAVMAGCRSGSRDLSAANRASWDEAEDLVMELRARGVTACNVGIELERAVAVANFVLPVNGLVGNQIYRSVVFLGGGSVLAVPAFASTGALVDVCYEDNSRNESGFVQHIRAAAAVARCRRMAAAQQR